MRRIKIVIMAVLGICGLLILKPPCIFHTLFKLDCPGCGATRMIESLLHLEFAQAFAYNQYLFVFGIPILLTLLDEQVNPKKRQQLRKILFILYVIIAILFFVWRNFIQ